tara:strand:+ start:10782 stop:11006 length:225 start_codon:yes stop_codon:yes gene_type:complete
MLPNMGEVDIPIELLVQIKHVAQKRYDYYRKEWQSAKAGSKMRDGEENISVTSLYLGKMREDRSFYWFKCLNTP